MKIEQRQAIRYAYKDGVYKVMFTSKMKIWQLWVNCIIYQSYKDKKIWVREAGEFFEKFKPTESV